MQQQLASSAGCRIYYCDKPVNSAINPQTAVPAADIITWCLALTISASAQEVKHHVVYVFLAAAAPGLMKLSFRPSNPARSSFLSRAAFFFSDLASILDCMLLLRLYIPSNKQVYISTKATQRCSTSTEQAASHNSLGQGSTRAG